MSNNEIASKIKEYAEIKRMATELADAMSEIEDQIKAHMGDTEEMSIEGYKVSFTRYETSRFDSSTFKKEHSTMYSQYLKTSTARRFSIK